MIIILTGPVHAGKTTLLEKSLGRWAARKLSVGGFLSIAVLNSEGQTEYDLLDLREGRRLPFLRRTGPADAPRAGPYVFVPQTFEVACSLIREAGPEEVLIVDEVGQLELAGEGLWPVVREVVVKPNLRVILVVREDLLEDFVKALGTHPALIVDVRDPNAQRLIEGGLFGTRKLDAGQG